MTKVARAIIQPHGRFCLRSHNVHYADIAKLSAAAPSACAGRTPPESTYLSSGLLYQIWYLPYLFTFC